MFINIPNSIKSFFSDSSVYMLVNIINKVIPFILLPLIIRLLNATKDQYRYRIMLQLIIFHNQPLNLQKIMTVHLITKFQYLHMIIHHGMEMLFTDVIKMENVL